MNKGRIVQVMGPVVDVVFENGDNNLFYEHIQHELNHVFQQIFQKGKYNYGKIRANIEKNKKENKK